MRVRIESAYGNVLFASDDGAVVKAAWDAGVMEEKAQIERRKQAAEGSGEKE